MGEPTDKIKAGSREVIKVILTKVAQCNMPRPKVFAHWVYPSFKEKWSEKFFVSVLHHIEEYYPDYYQYLRVPSQWNGGSLKKFPTLREDDGSNDPPANETCYIEATNTHFESPAASHAPDPPQRRPSPVRFTEDVVTVTTSSARDAGVVCSRCSQHIAHPPLKERERVQCTCGYTIVALNIPKTNERNKQSTIRHGTKRQKILLDVYMRYHPALTARDRPAHDSLDYTILQNGAIDHYLEIKERTNTLNAFATTRVTLHKMEVAQRLHQKTGKLSYILVKFIDCWTLYRVDPTRDYKKAAVVWGRNDRQHEKMMYADIPITELEVLDWNDLLEL